MPLTHIKSMSWAAVIEKLSTLDRGFTAGIYEDDDGDVFIAPSLPDATEAFLGPNKRLIDGVWYVRKRGA